jgi:hypothetical protein
MPISAGIRANKARKYSKDRGQLYRVLLSNEVGSAACSLPLAAISLNEIFQGAQHAGNRKIT